MAMSSGLQLDKKLDTVEMYLFAAWKIYNVLHKQNIISVPATDETGYELVDKKAEPVRLAGVEPVDYGYYSMRGIRFQFARPDVPPIVLLSPASDSAELIPGVTQGSVPMPQVAAKIAQLRKEDKRAGCPEAFYIIPVSQCQRIAEVGPRRRHWTVMVGSGKSGKAIHYDPKDMGRALYPTHHMRDLSREHGGFDVTTELSTKWQNATDFTSCGFFNAEIIYRIISSLLEGGDGTPSLEPVPEAKELREEFERAQQTREYQRLLDVTRDWKWVDLEVDAAVTQAKSIEGGELKDVMSEVHEIKHLAPTVAIVVKSTSNELPDRSLAVTDAKSLTSGSASGNLTKIKKRPSMAHTIDFKEPAGEGYSKWNKKCYTYNPLQDEDYQKSFKETREKFKAARAELQRRSDSFQVPSSTSPLKNFLNRNLFTMVGLGVGLLLGTVFGAAIVAFFKVEKLCWTLSMLIGSFGGGALGKRSDYLANKDDGENFIAANPVSTSTAACSRDGGIRLSRKAHRHRDVQADVEKVDEEISERKRGRFRAPTENRAAPIIMSPRL